MALTRTIAAALTAAAFSFAGFVPSVLGAQKAVRTKVQKQSFGKTKSGEAVDLYTLSNGAMEAAVMNYGGILVSVKVPDRAGKIGDVTLGFDNLDGYLGRHPFFGAIAGRYANRIAKGRFTLNGVEYKLAQNNGENALHGGLQGFDKRVWTGRELPDGVELKYISRDGEEGYPGTLTATVTYRLNNRNELQIDYHATTDKPTVLNLTNHTYFNLAGEGDILGHQVTLHADRFTPVDPTLIPTGELRPVAGTPFDFRQPHAIGERIDGTYEQVVIGRGYDHNFVLNGEAGKLRPAARAVEPKSGRVLEVLTTEPGVQFYTGNNLDGSIRGKGGRPYIKRAGFCLETQHFPDSPNKPTFPSVVLNPGQEFRSTTVFRFSVEK